MIIGYLSSDLFTSYSCTMWSGLRAVCREQSASLLYFSGGALSSPDPTQSARNQIYNLISKKNVDGILINSATIFHFMKMPEIEAFYKALADVPIVSVGVKVMDWPAVLTDNSHGILEAVAHLVQTHGHRRIGFISGPENNHESNLRRDAYRDALAACDIPFDPDLIVRGLYSIASGAESLVALFRKTDKVDAVLTANDDMAIGVMNQAQSMGIVIPNELAICGFDDIPEAPLLTVPLSTVRQPFLRQAQTACQMLIERIRHGTAPRDIILPTEFIQRRSCGCFSESVRRARIPAAQSPVAAAAPDDSDAARLLCRHRRAILDAAATAHQHLGRTGRMNGTEVMLDALISYLKAPGQRDASSAPRHRPLDEALERVDYLFNEALINDVASLSHWQDTVSCLIAETRPFVDRSPAARDTAQSFWHQVRVLLQETSYSSQSFSKMQSDFHASRLRNVSGKLVRSFELGRLIDTIRAELPKVDIQACYLVLHDAGDPARETSRVILAYNESGEHPLPKDGLRFRTDDLIPRELLSLETPDAHIVEALFFEGEPFGYILFKTNPQKVVFEELRQQISSAIKGAILTEEVRNLALEQKRHAKALQEAYDFLKQNQEKMLISEKMASLGRLTAGIAHEMNTPLATIRFAAMELESLIQEYRQSIRDSDVTPDDHQSIAEEMSRSTALIRKAAERTAGFVQGVKSQTRDLKGSKRHEFNAVPVIQEAILLLNHTIRKNNCPVHFHPSRQNIPIYGIEGRLAQVVTNLVVNAVDASKDNGGGPIHIDLRRQGTAVRLSITDSGSGIPDEILSKIFDPLFTTKSLAEGTGLGLSIVHDIICGEFGGAIDVESTVGKGTEFVLTFENVKKDNRDGKKVPADKTLR